MSSEIGEIALTFLFFTNSLKIYHWQTKSFARHKASDELVSFISSKTDQFIETMQGSKHTRLRVLADNSFKYKNQTDKSIVVLCTKFRDWLINSLPKYLNLEKDVDLMNLRDEIVGQINQILYLFTFE
jgi:hypothetical protein